MRHYPAHCPDCRRLWLVATAAAPSASPVCPRCGERGRLVPGAYYSDPASLVFTQLELSIFSQNPSARALVGLVSDLERVLPSPVEADIERAFADVATQFGIDPAVSTGKRVILRMLVTIASTLSQPVVRESGVMRLPQTIHGLFDSVPQKRSDSDEPK